MIADPIKKQEVKKAVLAYIDSKKIIVKEVNPFYRIYKGKDRNTFYTSSYEEVKEKEANGFLRDDILTNYVQGYVFKNAEAGTVPIYRLYKSSVRNTFYTTSSAEVKYMQNMGYVADPGRLGYIIGYMLPYKD